ncbi:HAD family hydrolase [Celerinatantimonas yamalensis]|uniref:phosphoglycolate phosphatase n=1 Tax=Celerinatantimonas yamalensis TaxID=559956 RepID=A0ABW9G6B0_9GAMM
MMIKKNIADYKTIVFDCDGVVFNSNKVKTQSFYDVAKVYGHEPAKALKDYHVQNGGISRYAKFKYLFTDILKKPINQNELIQLLDNFACEVKNALMNCEVADGLEELREKTQHSNWLIVSGGDQQELRELFKVRSLDHYFDGGIFGSPDTKETILTREIESGNIIQSALYIGDSLYDYQSAQAADLDFIFLTQWTEMKNYRSWAKEIRALNYRSIKDFFEHLC